jgi:hypothetical protein
MVVGVRVRRVWGGSGVREVVLHGALEVTEKMKKKNTHIFFVLFLGVVGTVVDGCGISRPPRCCRGYMFS